MALTTIPVSGPKHSGHRLVDVVSDWSPSTAGATGALVAVSGFSGVASLFARWFTDAGLSPVTVAVGRFAVIALVLGAAVDRRPVVRTATRWGMASGMILAAGFAVQVHLIETTPVATVSVAFLSFPVFAALGSRLLFGHRLAPRSVVAAGLVVVAGIVGLGAGGGQWTPLLAIPPLTAGVSIAVLTDRLGPLDPFARLGAVAVGAVVGLAPMLAVVDGRIRPSGHEWLGLAALGALCALVPMAVWAAAAPRLGAAAAAVAGTTELPVTFALGTLFLGEAIAVHQVLAGALIVGAVMVGTGAGGTRFGRARPGVLTA